MRSIFFSFALLGSIAPAAAQSLDVAVTPDPNAGLALYDFTVQAPPGSGFFMFGSLETLATPAPFPPVIHMAELDPLHVVPVCGPAPVGLTGQGICRFAMPLQVLQGVEIGFQGVVMDPAGILAFTPLATAVQGVAAAPAGNLRYHGGYNKQTRTYTLELQGPPGANIRLLINGGQKATGWAVLDGNGKGKITIQVDLKKNDGLTLEQNGQFVKGWIFP